MTQEDKGRGRKVRVKDAFKEDVGRGKIRIDPEVIKEMNLKTGDVIEIYHPTTQQSTAGLLWGGKSDDKGLNIIRIDASLRRNLGASIDDLVEVRQIEAVLAEKITFAGLKEAVVLKNSQQLAAKLENRIITKGDIISFYSMVSISLFFLTYVIINIIIPNKSDQLYI